MNESSKHREVGDLDMRVQIRKVVFRVLGTSARGSSPESSYTGSLLQEVAPRSHDRSRAR